MERTHHPRPFGCGLRACTEPCPRGQRRIAEAVTVESMRTQTVVDPGPVVSFSATVVAATTSDSERSRRIYRHLRFFVASSSERHAVVGSGQQAACGRGIGSG